MKLIYLNFCHVLRKKIFFFILALSLASTWAVNAQPVDYYTGKSSVRGDGYEYKVVFVTKYKVPMMFLNNVNNTKFDAKQYWPNGDEVGYDVALRPASLM